MFARNFIARTTFEDCNSVRISSLLRCGHFNKSVSQETEVKISGDILDADFKRSLFVEAGFSCALAIDGILNLEGTDMVFVPLESSPKSQICIIWKKYQVMTKAAEKFLEELKVD